MFSVFGRTPPLVFAAIAIVLWSSLAAMGRALQHVPPLYLLSFPLIVGALPSLPRFKEWYRDPRILLLGTLGIFGYHLLLFLALRWAPAVEANLVNYLWPLLIVLLSPLFFSHLQLGPRHLSGALLAFVGATWVITGGHISLHAESMPGYLAAASAALVWACYSLGMRKLGSPSTATVGGFCFFSGSLALLLHYFLEAHFVASASDVWLLVLTGIGPLGLAFYAWDASLKKGDPRAIGALAYFTPFLSTFLLVITSPEKKLAPSSFWGLLLISGGALLSSKITAKR